MTRRTKLLLPLLAALVVLGATALPGFAAPEKIFKLDITPTSAGSESSTVFQVKATNITPGNSNISSMTIDAPDGFTVTAASISTGTNANTNATVSFTATSVTVRNLDPIKRNQSLTLAITATAPTAGDCVSGSGTWDGVAFTGSQVNGDPFRLVTEQSTGLTTTVTAAECSLAFNPAPGNAGVGENIPVSVEVRSGGSVVTGFDGEVSLSATAVPTGAVLTGTGTVNAVNGVASFTLNGDTAGDYTVEASATGFGSISASFSLFAGEIFCGETPDEGESGAGELLRGAFNKDGSECVLVDYTYTRSGTGDDDVDNDLVNLEWDVTSQPAAAFEYTIEWDPELVSISTGLPTRITEVSWTKDGNGNPIFVPGRACWSNELPAPYGALGGAVTAGDGTISVIGASDLPATPFDIVIDAERLSVTAVDGSTWTVDRGVGGTEAASHAAGADVMSTPLPLDADGLIMPICIAEEGWVSAGQDLVRYTTRIFDIGDGTIRRR